jgi:hypothetical protein
MILFITFKCYIYFIYFYCNLYNTYIKFIILINLILQPNKIDINIIYKIIKL